MKLEEINGNEIISFLNEQSKNNDDLCDIGISSGSFVFVSQKIESGKYTLEFIGDYNNWGTEQKIYGNALYIIKDKVWFSLNEPFDGDVTAEELEAILVPWLKIHKFDSNPEVKFKGMIQFAREELCEVTFKDKKLLQKIIDELIEAKSYMK